MRKKGEEGAEGYTDDDVENGEGDTAVLTSSAVSSENVENVVKPPQMPTFKNKISRESRFEFFAARQAMTPIASEPKTLIKKYL